MHLYLLVVRVKDQEACCRVDAVVSMDAKGQIVMPKDMREKAGLKPDDKLAVIGCEHKGMVCCIILVKADNLGGQVKSMLGPMLRDVLK
jgi:AbrB family looped-hinge helix DNA binding protein